MASARLPVRLELALEKKWAHCGSYPNIDRYHGGRLPRRLYLSFLPATSRLHKVYSGRDLYVCPQRRRDTDRRGGCRGGLRVLTDNYLYLIFRIADVSRTLMELSVPEPPRAEFQTYLAQS